MNKMCIAYLGALVLALHLISSQVVHAQTAAKTSAPNVTASAMPSTTMRQTTVSKNSTSKDNGAGRTDAFTLLLPLAVGASLLLGWS